MRNCTLTPTALRESANCCMQCRSRRTKCDQSRPTCDVCRKAGLVCGRYEKQIFFDFEDPKSAGSGRFRRPLLTVDERRCMSELLTSSVPPHLAHRYITSIDDEYDRISAFQDLDVVRGPFGAFKVTQKQPQATSSPPCDLVLDDPEILDLSRDDLPIGQLESYSFDVAMSPGTQELLDSILGPCDLDPESHANYPLHMYADSSRIIDVSDEIFMSGSSQATAPPLVSEHHNLPHDTLGNILRFSSSPTPSSFTLAPCTPVPQDAVLLLNHYSKTVLPLLTPFRHSKTPWHVLFVPHAKSCLAALVLGEKVDMASLCAFYGILAISACSLGGVSHSHTWLEQRDSYEQQAHEHAKSMLFTAYDVPKTAKYKSILMALLIMVQISIVSGNQDQTERYFLEAEKFIRLRGLNRRKSRKVRLLHHCYAFERIFYESTFISGASSGHRRCVRKAIESSGLGIYSRDSLSFHGLDSCSNLEQDMLKVKCQDEGENDLHLQKPGVWSGTLYPEIFGVPEQWLMIVSLIIRLGKEKEGIGDQAGDRTTVDMMSLRDFLSQAKATERYLLRLQRPGYNAELNNLLDAMQNALIIYFYRRIYDVDASMLQPWVSRVRDCLMRLDSNSDSQPIYGAARYVWPAFIAACEAEDSAVQASFSNWFRNSAQQSGLQLFSDTLGNIERMWKEKQSAGLTGGMITWLELMKNGSLLGQIQEPDGFVVG